MKTHEISTLADKLDTQQKEAILQLIDLKITDDMETITKEFRAETQKLDNKITLLMWVIAVVGTVLTLVIALKK